MFDGRDTIVMFDKLAYEDMLPVRWCPTSETVSEVAAAQHLVERNLRVLQACDALEEHGQTEKSDDESPHSADLMRLDFKLKLACPPELAPDPGVLAWAAERQARVELLQDPREAVAGADAVLTDAWVSMGDGDVERRRRLLAPYQVDDQLMALTEPEALFMHCLPAHRGEEVTGSVIDGPRSVVFDQAENRLHAQKGILAWCLG